MKPIFRLLAVGAVALALAPLCKAECKDYEVAVIEFPDVVPESFTGGLFSIYPGQQQHPLMKTRAIAGVVTTFPTMKVDERQCRIFAGWLEPELAVAYDMARDQCAFDYILGHEREHVAIYRRGVAGLEARIRQFIASGQPAAQATSMAMDEVHQKQAAHDRADAPSYHTACNGKIAELMERYDAHRP